MLYLTSQTSPPPQSSGNESGRNGAGSQSELRRIFRDEYFKIAKRPRNINFKIELYPYTTFRHVARRGGDDVHIRLSDMINDAPPEIVSGIAHILISKVLGKRPDKEAVKAYRVYSSSGPLIQKMRERSEKKRKKENKTAGHHHNLGVAFASVKRLFPGVDIGTRISWSRVYAKRTLGHYNKITDMITINPRLDSPRVPVRVLEYVIYHEFLHATQPAIHPGKPLLRHDSAFRRREREFVGSKQAEEFLKNYHPTKRSLERERKKILTEKIRAAKKQEKMRAKTRGASKEKTGSFAQKDTPVQRRPSRIRQTTLDV